MATTWTAEAGYPADGYRRDLDDPAGLLEAFDTAVEVGQPVPMQQPGISLWLDADRAGPDGAAVEDGTSLTWWYDQSGNSRSVTQATGSNRPVMRTVGGRKFVRFDGSNDYMVRESAGVIDTTLPVTVYMVAMSANSNAAQTFWASGSSTDNDPVTCMDISSSARTQRFFRRNDAAALSLTDTPVLSGGYRLHVGLSDVGAGVRHWINGASAGGSADVYNPPATTDRFLIGARISASSSTIGQFSAYLDGDIGTLLIYNAAHTTAQRQAVEDYLAAKYALTLTRA